MVESLQSIAKMIDHSLLHPQLTDRDLIAGCTLAHRHAVASVCIKPYAVAMAREILIGSEIRVGTVIGFPHGSNRIDIKIRESEQTLADGAEELDLVVNIGKVLSQDWTYVSEEIKVINNLVIAREGIVKVIFENDFLTDRRYKLKLCEICSTLAVAFVKTSTGFGFVKQANGAYDYLGATDDDLVLMREHCIPSIQIKAAGKVRTLDDILRVRELGATRVGATATESILKEARERGFV